MVRPAVELPFPFLLPSRSPVSQDRILKKNKKDRFFFEKEEKKLMSTDLGGK